MVHYYALSKLLEYFTWTGIGVIVSEDSGEEDIEKLIKQTNRLGICIEYIIKIKNVRHIHDSSYFLDLKTTIHNAMSSVIVICRTLSVTFVGLLEYISTALYDKTLVLLPTSSADLKMFMLQSEGKMFNHSLFLQVPVMEIPGMESRLEITCQSNQEDKLLQTPIDILENGCNNKVIEHLKKAGLKNVIDLYGQGSLLKYIEFQRKYSMEKISWLNYKDSDICQKCAEDAWPNEKRDQCILKVIEFLSYTNDHLVILFSFVSVSFTVLTAIILGIFLFFIDTPIVKANNQNLSFLLLVSIILSYLCVFLFIGRPVDITCQLRQISFGIIFSVAVSSLLAKTIMVGIAFKATKPGSNWKKWMSIKLSNLVVIFFSSIQVIICVSWLVISPPFQELNMHSDPGKIIVQCNEGSVLAFYSVLGYMGLLAAVSFVIAFYTRTLPDSFNEAKYITFSMLVFYSVWIAMIPAYLSTKGKQMVAVEIFAILASNTGLLGCIFFPKCYIILFKPEINTKTHLLCKIKK
ncbi:vomeronasal type-2 receptor 26-like [Discoglossus pictus]